MLYIHEIAVCRVPIDMKYLQRKNTRNNLEKKDEKYIVLPEESVKKSQG
jgi:hypothetical protein